MKLMDCVINHYDLPKSKIHPLLLCTSAVCLPVFFRAMETAIQQLQTAIKKITHQYSAYGDDAAPLLAAFIDGSTLGRSLFHQINKKMQLTAKKLSCTISQKSRVVLYKLCA